MSAVRLEVETHIVHGSATALQNLTKCVRQAGVRVDELVVASLASGEAVLSETERELGVAVADIGAGTTDLALYMEGSPFHTSVLPLGGINVTNDVAIGLKTNLVAAEQLKIRFGTADPARCAEDEEIPVDLIGEGGDRDRAPLEVAEIIEARMREIFEKIGEEIETCGRLGIAAGRAGADGRRLAAGRHRRARPRGAADAGPGGLAGGRRRPDRPSADARPTRPRIGARCSWARARRDAPGAQRYESAPPAAPGWRPRCATGEARPLPLRCASRADG